MLTEAEKMALLLCVIFEELVPNPITLEYEEILSQMQTFLEKQEDE